jgi:hypothetical protein
MLRNEILKSEEDEVANAHERLFKPSDNNTEENDNKTNEDKIVEKIVDEELKKKELPEDDTSESSEKAEHEIKEEKVEDHNEPPGPNDDLHGSTVEIIQPADLKPKHLGFTRTLLLAMFAAMIGTGSQFGYAIGVMNAPSEVKISKIYFFL